MCKGHHDGSGFIRRSIIYTGYLALAVWTGAFLYFGAMAFAKAQGHDHHHPPAHAQLHDDFYSNWSKPNIRDEKGVRQSSCCNKYDCYPTRLRMFEGNLYAQRREDDRWLLVPLHLLEENYVDPANYGDGRESPDGQNHVCMSHPYRWYEEASGEYAPPERPKTGLPFEIATDGTVFCAVRGSGQ